MQGCKPPHRRPLTHTSMWCLARGSEAKRGTQFGALTRVAGGCLLHVRALRSLIITYLPQISLATLLNW